MSLRNLSPTPDTGTVKYCRNLIQQGEGVRVEFKTSFQKEVIETLVAFANTKRGAVLVDVNDDGQTVGSYFAQRDQLFRSIVTAV